ncbi:hypothetical protein H5410_064065 [Solanum commersonii]|uniref:Uncharacterized protein n=1 Tax=Solanum commersonii TaxID=4109 RepID=A0A9J5W178_SOLCO|nr:hypothetical protein H5410_064065 [Solanum commersonii]
MKFLVIKNSDLIFAKILPERPLRPYLRSNLALKAKTTHFQGKMIAGIVHGIFGYPNFRPHFCQNLTWTSVKTLSIEPIGTHGQHDLFLRLKRSPEQDLTYGSSWSSRTKWPIFKVKRSPEQSLDFLVIQNSDLIFAKILPGHPLTPYLWS